MPLRFCSQSACKEAADRGQGTCVPCGSHFCARHLLAEQHICRKLLSADPDAYYEKYFKTLRDCHQNLIDKLNLAALQEVASRLRNGIACSLPAFENGKSLRETLATQMGGQNFHIDVNFVDGVRWIARVRLDDPIQAPASIRDYVVLSEVATLHFLEQTAIPTARVHHYTLSTKVDEVGVPYMLMDKLEGRLLDFNQATKDQKTKILNQLADHSLALRAHPFDSLGSLNFDADGRSLVVGPYALWQLWKNPSHGLGPYFTTGEAYRDILQMYIDFYRTGELDNLALDNILALTWRARFLEEWHLTSKEEPNKFYLMHQDDKGDHILVDDDFVITGILDWETATLEPEEVAFGSPLMLWPVGDFYDGKNNLSSEELELAQIFLQKGEERMSSLVLHGRLYQRFLFFLGGGSESREDFVGLLQGLRRAADALPDHDKEADEIGDMTDYKKWKEVEMEHAEVHIQTVLDQIKQRHRKVYSDIAD